jgi:cathepsin L
MFKALALALVCAVAVSALAIPEEDMQAIFTGYMTRQNKVYAREEFFNRYNIFKAAYEKIMAHNALPAGQNKGVKLGATSLADLNKEEYRSLLGFKATVAPQTQLAGKRHHRAIPEGEIAAGDSVDWVAAGAVNAIKDQGSCGSCWAFSAVAATESAIFLAGNALPSLSEQELVDCSTGKPYYCEGCDGCLMATAYQYILDKKGLCTEKEYPYTGEDDTCASSKCTSTKVPLKSYYNITCADSDFCDKTIKANETTIKTYVAKGVVSVAIEADSDVFQYYESGILDDDSCGTELDHGVDIVGYGADASGNTYWTVRNSWGTSWGLKGYVQIAQGKNMCGIALYAEQAYA